MKHLIYIYTLQLEHNCYYVGKSKNQDRRIKCHGGLKGAQWTKLHKPVNVEDVASFEVLSDKDEECCENEVTLKVMKTHGWKNVRGGFWCCCGEYETLKGLQAHGYFMGDRVAKQSFSDRKYYIYTLELEGGFYYVGHTGNLSDALRRAEKGKAAEWVRLHKPIALVEVEEYTCREGIIGISVMNQFVVRAFERYGYENVRGGSFNIIDPERHARIALRKF